MILADLSGGTTMADIDPGDLIEPVVDIVAAGLDGASSSRDGRGFGIFILIILLIAAIVIGVLIVTSDDNPTSKPAAVQGER
jgi:hypothetical protein